MPPVGKPKLVNRGPAGLLDKVKVDEDKLQKLERPKSFNKIVPALKGLAIDIEGLTPDPRNARLHPERNMEAIMDSLAWYGQRFPIVVRKEGMIVVAGNGRLAAAKALGWTKIAATVQSMTDVEAAGFGLADNRTAELARWDFEVVASLDKLISDSKGVMAGWSPHELEVLRIADWTPPEVLEDEFDASLQLTVKFTPEQKELIDKACAQLREVATEELSDADCLHIISTQWLEK